MSLLKCETGIILCNKNYRKRNEVTLQVSPVSYNLAAYLLSLVICIFGPLARNLSNTYYGDFSLWFHWFSLKPFLACSWLCSIIVNPINSLIWKPDNYQSLQSNSKVRGSQTTKWLPWSHIEHPATSTKPVCTEHMLVNSLTFTQDTTFIMMMTVFFLFKADKLHQVFPSYLDTKIKSPPNFWLLSSAARVLKPAPESCSPSQVEGEWFHFQELSSASGTKHSGINK